MGFLMQLGAARVEWLDQNGNVISTQNSTDWAEGYSREDVFGMPAEQWWEISKHTFSRSSEVFGVNIRAWLGVIVDDWYFDYEGLDNLRYTPNPPPPDEDEEKGCGNDNLQGNPCNVATGNKYHVDTDYNGGTNELAFRRSYNSYESLDFGNGVGWTSSLAKRLEIDGDSLVIRQGDGKGEKWTNISGIWEGEEDSDLRLLEYIDGFLLSKPDGSAIDFDLFGKIISETDASSKSTLYAYNLNGRLETVTGPFGHKLEFTYNATGQIEQMRDPANQLYGYGYDATNNLTTVTFPDSSVVTYHYENTGLPNQLTGITDRNSDRIATYTYLANGAAKTTEHADIGNGTQEKLAFIYDFGSEETLVTDAAGTTNRLFFETNLGVKNMVRQINVSDGKEINQTFDLNNNLLSVTDEEFRTTANTYNSFNQKTSMTEALGTPEERTTTFGYVSPDIDLPTLIVRPSVFTGATSETSVSYDSNLNISSVSYSGFDPSGSPITRSTTWTYNNRGQVTSMDGFREDVIDTTIYTYYECTTGNECGQLASSTNALSHVTTFDDYDAHGRLLRSTDSNGLESSYSYDYYGRIISIAQVPTTGQGTPRTSTFVYDEEGQLRTAIMPDGVTLTHSYNAAHYLTSIVDNVGNRIDYGYDRKGNRTQTYESDPDGTLTRVTDLTYDIRNHLSTRNADGSVTQMTFDAVGDLTALKDPNVNPTNTYNYDSLSRLTQLIDDLGNPSSQQHDVNDNIIVSQAPNSATTTYSYNDFEFRLQETSPDRGIITYLHDVAGNVISTTDARGITTFYSYDALNRVVMTDYLGTNEDISYIYDSCAAGIGRLCRVIDESGVTDYTYDVYGNILTQTQNEIGIVSVIQYEYDNGNNVVNLTYPDATEIAYQRDAIKRISAIECQGCGGNTSIVINRQYRSDGLLLNQTFGNGLVDTRNYDLQGRLELQIVGSAVNKNYTYDANGNILQKNSYKYNYDELDRLISEKITGKANSITYDANGNRLSYSKDDYAYLTGSNVLTSVENNPATTYASGHITQIRDLIITYNNAGRISRVDNLTTGESNSYTYNAFGQRTRKDSVNGTSLYFYDLEGHLIAESDIANALVSNYVWADDMPVAQHAITKITTTTGKGRNRVTTITYDNQFVYLHTDNIETPRVATDAQGIVAWEWDYDSFGRIPANDDPDGDSTAILSMLRFPGQHFDSESGLHYNNFRYYDPSTGRYIQSDPIGLDGGWNTYAYVKGNPLMYVDPTGENPVGMAIGFGIELGMQLAMNGGNLECVDWTDVAVSTIVGAVAPGALSTGKTVLNSSKAARNLAKQSSRARTINRQNKINSRLDKHKNTIRDALITQAAWQGAKQVGKNIGNSPSDDCGCDE